MQLLFSKRKDNSVWGTAEFAHPPWVLFGGRKICTVLHRFAVSFQDMCYWTEKKEGKTVWFIKFIFILSKWNEEEQWHKTVNLVQNSRQAAGWISSLTTASTTTIIVIIIICVFVCLFVIISRIIRRNGGGRRNQKQRSLSLTRAVVVAIPDMVGADIRDNIADPQHSFILSFTHLH